MNLSEGHQIFIRAKDDNHTVFSFSVIEDKAWVKENQIKSVVEIPTMDIYSVVYIPAWPVSYRVNRNVFLKK